MAERSPAIAALTAENSGLGLAHGEVRVVPHQPDWDRLFGPFGTELREALGDNEVRVEHVGSSSVPGLAAKPIMDVAVGLPPPIDAASVVASLVELGLGYQDDLGDYGGLLFSAASDDGLVVAHVHVVALDSFQWRWYLAFRYALRQDPDLRREYEELKSASASQHGQDREAYSNAKFEWILNTVTHLDEGT